MQNDIFVYGSLKRGFCNHAFLRGARFMREDCTAEACFLMGAFRAADPTQGGAVYAFPGIVRLEEPVDEGVAGRIRGEVYTDVSDALLEALDVLEEVGAGLFRREQIVLEGGGTAWMYMLGCEEMRPALEDSDQVHFEPGERVYNWV